MEIEMKSKFVKAVPHRFRKNIKDYKYAYMLIFPALIAVFVFSYLPICGIVLAFKDFDVLKGIFGSPWVGFNNFITIFNHPVMLKAISNTLLYSSINLFGLFPVSIILALLFNEIWNLKFKKVVQTVSYMPHFLSWISVVGLCYTFLGSDGSFNEIMAKIVGAGYKSKNILMDVNYFIPVMFLSSLWKSTGWSSIIYLAAIAGIDPALYEAATVDGSGKLRQIWHITLPGIKTTIIVVFVMSLGSLFASNFEQIYGLQNVYTQDATEVIGTFIYRQGIQNGKYSLTTALGLAQGLVTVTIILCANAISKKLFETSIW